MLDILNSEKKNQPVSNKIIEYYIELLIMLENCEIIINLKMWLPPRIRSQVSFHNQIQESGPL